MINKITENFPNELTLFPIKDRNNELSFSGDRISFDGGLLLLRELDNPLCLAKRGELTVNVLAEKVFH